jgi:hypothetical protein
MHDSDSSTPPHGSNNPSANPAAASPSATQQQSAPSSATAAPATSSSSMPHPPASAQPAGGSSSASTSTSAPQPATLTAFLNANGKRALPGGPRAADKTAASSAENDGEKDGDAEHDPLRPADGDGAREDTAEEELEGEGAEHKPGWYWTNPRAKEEMARAMDLIVGKQYMIKSELCCPGCYSSAD